MVNTNFERSIPSRPVYGDLEPRPGSAHLIVADGEGGAAVVDLFAKASAAAGDAGQHTYHLCAGRQRHRPDRRVQALGAAQFYRGPSFAAAASRLPRCWPMPISGSNSTLTGTEGLMAQAAAAAHGGGLYRMNRCRRSIADRLARRVQCVHCKGITENVAHRSRSMQPLRAEPVRARPLLAPDCRLSGRQH